MYSAQVSDGPQNQKISDDDYSKELEQVRKSAEFALALVVLEPTGGNVRDARVARAELRAARDEVARRYHLYRNIPYEADAHEVGDSVERLFLRPPEEQEE